MSEFDKSLNQIGVRSPCNANWDEMQGNDQIRFCQHCKLSVHNLSAMTKERVLQLVAPSEDRLCVKFYRLPDGSLKTTDNPGSGFQINRKVSRIAAGAFTAAMALSTTVNAYGQSAPLYDSQTQTKGINKVSDPARPAETGSMTGEVVDINGSVIRGASITLTSKESGQVINGETNEAGEFHFNLAAGDYGLRLSSPGFETVTLPTVKVAKGIEKRIGITMQVGSMGDVIFIGNQQIDSPVGKMGETLTRPNSDNNQTIQVKQGLPVRGDGANNLTATHDQGALKLILLDVNGAVVGGASVVLTNKKTGQKAETRTDNDGRLNLKSLAASRYILELSSPGFEKVTLPDVPIEAGQGTVLAVTMQVGVGMMGILAVASEIIPTSSNTTDGSSVDINDVDERTGLTPLAKALADNDINKIKRLLAAGADISVRTLDGRTVLMTINEQTKMEAVRELLFVKPDLNSKDLNRQTVLMIASKIGREDIVKILLDSLGQSADINTSDYLGNTALIYAVANKKLNTVKLLTAAGADLNVKNSYGVTALDFAQGNDDKEMIKFLKEHGAIQ